MDVKIVKLHPSAHIPESAHPSDFGMDITATSVEKLSEHLYRYHTGLSFQPVMCAATGSQCKAKIGIIGAARSSTFRKHGMILVNGIGIIDAHYTGEVTFDYYHLDPSLPPYEAGERIGQIFLTSTMPINFVPVPALDDTDRGTGGTGSTGD